MPELPEVETMRRIVEAELVGRTLAGFDLTLPKLTRESPIQDFGLLLGRTVLASRRRAKILVIDWSDGVSTLSHFMLAGQIMVERADGSRRFAGHPVPNPNGPYPHRATHLTMRFDDGTVLWHSDIRQFGWIRLMPSDEVAAAIEAFGLGPEAVGPDRITSSQLADRLQRRRVPVKQVLLDQAVVAGLGNIYVDEALHGSGIHPSLPASALDPSQVKHLHRTIAWSLEKGIAQGGATIVHQKAYPKDGFPTVHGREGEPCVSCKETIVKTRVGGRGTYFCPRCQRLPDEK